MEQHPIPRQITTFEFKLIGFMTLKQFLYLLIFIPVGVILWAITPIPGVNYAIGGVVILIGVAFAFAPVNDRPLEVWIRNLLKRLTSPTQYLYHKHNPPLYFLQDLYFVSDPHKVVAHIESKQKLAAYLATTQSAVVEHKQKKHVQTLLKQSSDQLHSVVTNPVSQVQPKSQEPTQAETVPSVAVSSNQPRHPFLTGVVKNNRKIPLPGIMIYIKDNNNATLRLLKTNPHGVFATYNNLSPSEYAFELKDPKGGYFFDTMKLKVEENNVNPFEFYSKELL